MSHDRVHQVADTQSKAMDSSERSNPHAGPVDLRSLLVFGPVRSPDVIDYCDGATMHQTQEMFPESDFESERTGQWCRPGTVTDLPTEPSPQIEGPDASDLSWIVERPRRRRRNLMLVAAFGCVGIVSYLTSSQWRAEPKPATHEGRTLEAGSERSPPTTQEHAVSVEAAAPIDEVLVIDEGSEPLEPPEPEALDELQPLDPVDAAAERRQALAIKRAKKKARRLWTRARAAIGDGRREDAIPLYERVVELDPELAPAAVELSAAYFDEGDFVQAVRYAEQAISVDAEHAEYHVALGDAYFRSGRSIDARRAWERAEALGSSRARKRLGKR